MKCAALNVNCSLVTSTRKVGSLMFFSFRCRLQKDKKAAAIKSAVVPGFNRLPRLRKKRFNSAIEIRIGPIDLARSTLYVLGNLLTTFASDQRSREFATTRSNERPQFHRECHLGRESQTIPRGQRFQVSPQILRHTAVRFGRVCSRLHRGDNIDGIGRCLGDIHRFDAVPNRPHRRFELLRRSAGHLRPVNESSASANRLFPQTIGDDERTEQQDDSEVDIGAGDTSAFP